MTDDIKQKAKEDLLGVLEVLQLPIKGSYSPKETQQIIGICDRTFWRYTREYELNPATGEPRKPATLDSFMLRRSRRVRFEEIVKYFARNNLYERSCR